MTEPTDIHAHAAQQADAEAPSRRVDHGDPAQGPTARADDASDRIPVEAAERVLWAQVGDDPITAERAAEIVGAAHVGAVVSFAGVVRDHDGGRGVTGLEYSAHPTAQDVLRATAERVAAAHPHTVIAIAHRIGPLAVGDVALACAVSSAHRAEAFAACSALVDEVKASVPIWKEQSFDDGSSEWVASLG